MKNPRAHRTPPAQAEASIAHLENELPGRPVGLAEPMRAGGVFEREHIGDLDAQPAGLDELGEGEQPHAVRLGEVVIPYTFTGLVGEVDTRVWDIAPNGGPTLLVTRGTYRLNAGRDAPAGTLRLPLFGNHYQLKPGHRVRIDLQEDDSPTFRPNNTFNRFTFSKPKLVLPTRQSGDKTLTGTGG